MTDIFSEIQEDIRRERLKKLWDRWGLYVVALALIIVIGVGGWRAWEWYAQKQSAATGARFEAALDLAQDGKNEAAVKALDEIAASGGNGYAMLARFRAAVAKAASDPDAGANALVTIAKDDGVPRRVRHLASLRAGMILLGTKNFTNVKPQIEALAAPGNPWRNSAREILALDAWRAGDAATTRKLAEEMVADASSPPGIHQRASLLLALAESALASKPSPTSSAKDKPAAAPKPGVPQAAGSKPSPAKPTSE